MAKLGVNIDHIATIRQARGTRYPDPVTAATIAENAGADQITIHLREDRRHIQDADLRILRKTVRTLLNLEMAAEEEIADIAISVSPNICTLVPERRLELTTEGGLDVAKTFDKLRHYIDKLKDNSITVSLFIDPDIAQVEASKEIGADTVELHTGKYSEFASGDDRQLAELERLRKSAKKAKELGLYVAAGHGLNYINAALVVSQVPEIVEYNIGHSIVARAVFVGLEQAVMEMKQIVGR